MLLLVVFFVYGNGALYPEFVKRGDWTQVAQYVEANETENQPVVVFRTYKALAFKISYHGTNDVFPDEQYVDWYYEGEHGTEEMWPKQQEFVIGEIPVEAREVWLVTEDLCYETKACSILEKHVERNYTVVKEKTFYLSKVRLLRRK